MYQQTHYHVPTNIIMYQQTQTSYVSLTITVIDISCQSLHRYRRQPPSASTSNSRGTQTINASQNDNTKARCSIVGSLPELQTKLQAQTLALVQLLVRAGNTQAPKEVAVERTRQTVLAEFSIRSHPLPAVTVI